MCLLLGTALTILFSVRVRHDEAQRLQAALHRSSVPVAGSIQRVLDRHAEITRSVAALFYASEQVTREEFREFTRDSLAHHPSIQALQWVPRVAQPERKTFEQRHRNTGRAGFSIRQRSAEGQLIPATARSHYFPVAFVEPEANNPSALGFDLASDPDRQSALLQATISGTSVISAPIHLAEGASTSPLGLFIVHPVYQEPVSPDDPAQPGNQLTGYALGVFRVLDLVEEALQAAPAEGIHYHLRDETNPATPRLLYASESMEGAPDPSLEVPGGRLPTWSTPLRVPGRRWAISFWPKNARALAHDYGATRTWLVLSTSTAITLLVSGALLVVVRHTAELETQAAALARANRKFEDEHARSESILKTTLDGYLLTDTSGQVLDVNPAYCELVGHDRETLLSLNLRQLEKRRTDRELEQHLQATVTAGGARYETRHRHRDGHLVELDVHTTALQAEGRTVVAAFLRDITERKHAEQALRESENRLRTVIDNAAGIFWILDSDGVFVLSEGRGLETIGVQPRQVVGKSLFDLYEGNVETVSAARRALAGEPATALVEVAGHTFDVRYFPDRDETGAVKRAVGVALNVTERTRTEEALRASEANYRALFEAEPDAIILVDAETQEIVDANPAAVQLYGYSRDELGGMAATILSAEPEQSRAYLEQITRIARTGSAVPPGYRQHRKKDGTVFPVEITPGHFERGGRLMLCTILRDVSQREQTEAALREREDRFRQIAENIQEVFWLFDWERQQVVYASPAYEAIWKRQVEDLYARYEEWGDSIHPDDREFARESLAQTLETEGGQPREYRIVRPDGEVRWVDDRAFPVRDANGKIVRLAGIAEDITDRKRQEEERQRLESKMQHAQKLESLGVLAGGIAHDFNNLLMAILGNADLALLRLAPGAPARDHLENIETAAQRAAELTNQMLAYSGKGRFVVQSIQLHHLVEEMAHLMETAISKKASLQMEFAHQLPAIEADPSQMRQVVMNLITNASEALEDLPGTIRIKIDAIDADHSNLAGYLFGDTCPAGRYVCLEVSDTGCGMDPDSQRKIFDPFFTTKFTGRGLGLAAVHGIVNGHHGAIRVSSEPLRGTTIQILFPAGEDLPAPLPGPPDAPQTEAKAAVVLVVDDDPRVLDVAVQMLEHAGFKTRTAADGKEGVEVFRTHAAEIALVILDMTMPRMDGEEAFREIRRIRPDARVILSSGYNQQDATNRFAGGGLAGFIQKPYRSANLLKKIFEVLETS